MTDRLPATTPGAELPPAEPSPSATGVESSIAVVAPTPEQTSPRRRGFHISDKVQFLATSFFTQFLRILTTLAMARLLTKGDYGLVTIAGALPAVVANLGDMGVSRSIVQMRDDPREKLEDTGLVISLAMGLLLLIASVGSGVFLAWQREDPRMLAIGGIVGITMLLGMLYQFQMACLNRDMKFRAESVQNLIFSVATMVTGLGLAFIGWGVFALVLQPLVAQVLANIAVYRHHPVRWPKGLSLPLVRKMLSYGGRVTLAQYLWGMQQTIVSLVVGFAFGKRSDDLLGILGRATQVRDLVGHNISSSFDRLLYPMLRSSMTAGDGDNERVRSLILRGLAGVALLCTFAWAWMSCTADELVRVMLGPDWPEVPALLRAVAPGLLFTAPTLMAIVITHALGRPTMWMRHTILGLVLLVAALAAGLPWGLTGLAIGITAAQAVSGTIFAFWAARAIRLPAMVAARRLAPILLAGAGAAATMLALRGPVTSLAADWGQHLPHTARSIELIRSIIYLVIVSSAGLLVYGLVVFALARDTSREILGLVRRNA